MEKVTALMTGFIEDVNNEDGRLMNLFSLFLRYLFVAILLIGIPVISSAIIQLFHLLSN